METYLVTLIKIKRVSHPNYAIITQKNETKSNQSEINNNFIDD